MIKSQHKHISITTKYFWSHSPLPCILENTHHLLLWRASLYLLVVLPPGEQRKRHQNALNACIWCEESELCAAILHQIELHIAPSLVLLPAHILIILRRIFASLQYLFVGIQGATSAVFNKFEGLSPAVVQDKVVKEYSPYTSSLPSELDHELLVALFFEFGIESFVLFVTGVFKILVEAAAVLLEQIVRCQISTPAKPLVEHLACERR